MWLREMMMECAERHNKDIADVVYDDNNDDDDDKPLFTLRQQVQ